MLVGTACAGVHRYDLDLNAAAFPAPSTPSPTPLLGKFVRAIEIEDRAGPSDRVFFALNADGLGMYEFDATSFTALVPEFRPDLNGNGIPDVQLWNSLSFDDSSKRLIAGLGPAFAVEKQFGSPSREPLSCIAPDPKPEDGGVAAFSVAAFSVAANSFLLEASNTVFGGVTDRKQPTAALQFRPVSATEYYIDAAAGGDGVWSYHATADVLGAWSIVRAGIGHELNQSVSLTTTDEVLFLDDHLYVSNEDALSSYDRTGPTPASMLLPGSILKEESTNTLTGFSGPEARLYSSGFGALRVYDLDPSAAVPVPGPVPIELDGGGRAFATRANLGAPLLHNPVTGVTGPRWLARVFYTLENSMGASLGTGGIRVIHVGTATNGDDPQVQTVTEWLHRGPWPGTSQLLPNASPRDVAFSGVGNGQYWYVSYGPQPATVIPGTGGTGFYPAETGIGLLTLQVNANPGRPVSLQVVDREHIVTSVDDTDPWRVTYDPVRQAVYVACSSQGFAVFDASNRADPSLIYHRDLFSAPGEVATAYQIQRGPGDQLVISYLDRGLLVIDDWDDPQSSSTLYSTRFQAIGLVPDTSDPSGTSFFVADGRAGALRVTLP